MRTFDAVREEHESAVAQLLELLSDNKPRSTAELVEEIRRRGDAVSSGTVRRSVWKIVEDGKAKFGADRKLILAS